MSNKYQCEICNKIFKQKNDYTRHIQRLTPCSPSLDEPQYIFTENGMETNPNSCSCCYKLFSNKTNKNKHEKNGNCLEKKIKESPEYKLLEEENKILKLAIANGVENNKSIDATNNAVLTIGSMTHSNVNSHNVYNIIINKYKNEDTSYLTDDNKIEIIKKYFKSIITLIDKKHFNKKHPENSNVYTSNLLCGYSNYYNGVDWVVTKNKILVDELYENNLNEVIEMYDDIKEQLDENTKRKFNNFIEQKDTSSNVKLVRDEIKMLLYEKREEVIKIKKMMKMPSINE
jgi:hypothetical protein